MTRDPFKTKEIQALLDACPRSRTGIRDRALIAFLAGTGARITEVLKLKPTNINITKRTVRFEKRTTKGKRERTVGLDPSALSFLESWLALRRQLGVKRSAPVFCSIRKGTVGKPLDRSQIHTRLKALGKKAGIDEERVFAHMFRHSVITDLLNRGVPIHRVRDQAGHRSISTTNRYAAQSTPSQLADAMTQGSLLSPHEPEDRSTE